MMVRYTVTNHSGSTIRQLTLKVCCWLAEDRLDGFKVRCEQEADLCVYGLCFLPNLLSIISIIWLLAQGMMAGRD